jgi:hypothetical protein
VKGGNLVVFRESRARYFERVTSGFKEKNAMAGFSESRRNGPTARA